MNEQIKELADQAGFVLWKNESWNSGDVVDWSASYDDELEKFTKLVVKECCKTLEEMHRWQSVNNQNYPSAWHDAVDQGIENIKEHFGVKE